MTSTRAHDNVDVHVAGASATLSCASSRTVDVVVRRREVALGFVDVGLYDDVDDVRSLSPLDAVDLTLSCANIRYSLLG